jgi:hypothetical protein
MSAGTIAELNAAADKLDGQLPTAPVARWPIDMQMDYITLLATATAIEDWDECKTTR